VISKNLRRAAFSLFLATAAAGVTAVPRPAFAQKAGAKPEEINLPVGGNKTYPAADVKNYSEGVPGIADVKLSSDNTQFVITAQKPGSTTLLLLKKDGTQANLVINVYARAPEVVKRELQQLLENTPGVNVRQVGSRFFIEGGVNSEGDARRVAQIASLYSGQVESLVTVGAPAVDRKFNIRIDFFFIQYDKRSSYAVGISYPARIGGEAIQSNITFDLIAGTTTTAQASVVNQPLPGLDLAARKGWAKVMKQATVVMQNGTEGSFESGGEQNFSQVTGLVAQIFRINYGTHITVLPRYDVASGEMELRVNAEVSDLTPAAANTPLPGRNVSKLGTNVHMKLGQSLILSGIRSQSQQRSSTGLPLLSEIPLLGALFGTQAGLKEDVEGAVFVIPSVVESVPRTSQDLVTAAMRQYEKFNGDLEDMNAYDKKPPPGEPPTRAPAESKE
jgi:pilus assembly protein CpaC